MSQTNTSPNLPGRFNACLGILDDGLNGLESCQYAAFLLDLNDIDMTIVEQISNCFIENNQSLIPFTF